ncbi:MAG: tetratricopeptide repeat protein [Bryobacterales bacterium]|nr:tetratricopeptide repeat protein [Bryobacterales bacterium]
MLKRLAHTSIPASELIREHMQRLIAAPEFAQSGRLCRFVRFTVELALEGRSDELKEQVLGTEVFDRGPGFDPRIDSIVRVEARRLRKKLKAFYERCESEPVELSYPEGSYAPVFRWRDEARAVHAPAAPEPSAAPIVAVLPFVNTSAEPGQDFLSDGITEAIIHALTAATGLRVVARTSVFQFKGQTADIREIAERLGATLVLEGSVRRAGDKVRVTARLIDPNTGTHVWSSRYDHTLNDIFAIEDDISESVVQAIVASALGPAPSIKHENLDAYLSYLGARHQFNKQSREGLNAAIDMYRQLIARFPDYALAHAGLGEALGMLCFYGGARPLDVLDPCRAAVARAVELDPSLPEALTVLAALRSFFDFQWEEGERTFLRALEIAPSNPHAHHLYAMHLLAQGQKTRSGELLVKAAQLDPLSLDINTSLGIYHYFCRDFERATEQLRRTLELDENAHDVHFHLGFCHMRRGLYAEAEAAIERSLRIWENPLKIGVLGELAAVRGQKRKALEYKARLDACARKQYVPAVSYVFLYAGLRDWDNAFVQLEAAFEQRSLMVNWTHLDARFDAVRHTERFQSILATRGLAAEVTA